MIKITNFDYLNEQEIKKFTFKNDCLEVSVLNFGGIIQSFKVNGTDIVLGFDSVADYLRYDIYAGAVVGRVANVIENSCYTIDGVTYNLTANVGKHCNHSGTSGFDKRIFDYEIIEDKLVLSLFSKDGDGGFGGNLNFKVEYTLKDEDFTVKFIGKSDKKTPFAPTMHPYFNLLGDGFIYQTKLKINGEFYTPVNSEGIPTGEVLSVKNTPFDFTEFKDIGKDIFNEDSNLQRAGGYDINYIVKTPLKATAVLQDSGVTLSVYSNMNSLQFYTANDLTNEKGKNGKIYRRHSAFCLEPQFTPNAINNAIYELPIIEKDSEVLHYITYSVKKTK